MIVAASAAAAPVVCDPAEAARILADANVDERRAPVTHPQLLPGLARGRGDPALEAALGALCAPGGDVSVERADASAGGGWAAYTVVVGRAVTEGCSLVHERVPVSVGVGPDGVRYGLRGAWPPERTPVGDCPDPPRWRDERTVAGADDPVRLVHVVDHDGDDVVAERLVVRRATPDGWSEQVLLEPAPPRLADPDGPGPEVHLAWTRDRVPLVVATGCRPQRDQTVWRPADDGWDAISGREAATLLAREGLWRLAGDDGWLLVLAQDDEDDRDLVVPRVRRFERRDPEPLYLLPSADFPELNAGYVVVAPGPWPTEAEAEAARHRWGRSASAYVKRAWSATDPCAP